MIDSYSATYVTIGFLLIFGVLLPIIDKTPKIKSIVSFRWSIIVIYSALTIGVILDFSHLDNNVRFAIVLGGILLSAIFLIVRSIEKAIINHWELPKTRASIKKGNISAELSLNPKIAVDDNSVINILPKKTESEEFNELQEIECSNEIEKALNNKK